MDIKKSDFKQRAGQGQPRGPLPPELERKLGQWPPSQWSSLFWYMLFMLATLWFWQEAAQQLATRTIPYSQFKTLLQQGDVVGVSIKEAEITGQATLKSLTTETNRNAAATNPAIHHEPSAESRSPRQISANSSEGKETATAVNAISTAAITNKVKTAANSATYLFRTVRVDDPDLVRDLEKAGIEFTGVRQGFMSQLLWAWVLPIAAMMLLWRLLAQRVGSLSQGIMSIGASKAKVVADKDTGVTFDDVAGCDEAKLELQEVVSFLKNPDQYKSLGASIPKGVLLIGPPGTGKTLLARAVAGEAKVPFFLISGSDFVEMFVGVGAARVRDLFEKAKAQAPCIVFIDELDAVARQRGVHLGAVNDEREQTLNQLLVGMDGFETNVGVIVLAATNRPEVLDRALLRPGRFDRQVVVDAPDLEGRVAILKIHVRNKPLAEEVDLRKVARQTPGFSGADLANVINEAALLAARHQARQISQQDLDDAVDKVVAGPERKSRRLGEDEKRRVAYHEVGHALVAAHSSFADPVHKITIVPHGHAALGYTMQLPSEDHYLMNRSALLDKINGLLGGRASEDLVFGEVSTGAENDLQQATALARQMVAVYGMSDVVGLAHCAQRPSPFAPGIAEGPWQRDCSEQTARDIDQEVKKILDHAYDQAKAILSKHRGQLDRVAAALLERETLDDKSFQRLLQQEAETPTANGVLHFASNNANTKENYHATS